MRWIKDIFSGGKTKIDDNLLEKIEITLLEADFSYSFASQIVKELKNTKFSTGENLETEVINLIKDKIRSILVKRVKKLDLLKSPEKPKVMLMCGVNGSGKTTTIGKLLGKISPLNLKTYVVAADTFRAAAVEQLERWVIQGHGTIIKPSKDKEDPSAVSYRAIKSAADNQADLVIIDTAGRLPSNKSLMAELAKIYKTLRKLDADFPNEVLMVLDASIGQNSLKQLEIFQEYLSITGLIVTKLDSTSRCGILVTIAEKFDVNIYMSGYGEKTGDLGDFDIESFINKIF